MTRIPGSNSGTTPTGLLIPLAMVSAVILAFFILSPPIPQDSAYHRFADTRTFFGIENFWNVLTSGAFLIVGAAALWNLLQRSPTGLLQQLTPVYATFFAGVFLTGLGSGLYHLRPDNFTLMWDRMAMTIAFAAFFLIVVGEHITPVLARRCLIPLVLLGITTVLYWYTGEQRGHGDLRAYALIQFLPMLAIPIILTLYPSPFHSRKHLWLVVLVYAMAKVAEMYDSSIYATLSWLSGHSLKHLLGAAAAGVLLLGLHQRRLP